MNMDMDVCGHCSKTKKQYVLAITTSLFMGAVVVVIV